MFGVLLVNELVTAAKSRHDTAQARRRPFYLYIDEFGRFISRDIARALEETRKYGLHFILAHQHLAQLEKKRTNICIAPCLPIAVPKFALAA